MTSKVHVIENNQQRPSWWQSPHKHKIVCHRHRGMRGQQHWVFSTDWFFSGSLHSVRGHQLLANSLVGCTVVICHPQQYIVLTPVIGWWRFMWLWFNNPCQGLGWLNSQLLLTIHQNKSPFVLVFQYRKKISKCGLPTSMFHIPAY